MPSVKRTFTLPNEISEELDQTIPNKERSKFLADILKAALKERKKAELLYLMSNNQPQAIPHGKKPIVDALTDIRSAQRSELQGE